MNESLGIENVFEGIENEEELNMVKPLHCSVIQGYTISVNHYRCERYWPVVFG